MIGKGRDNKLPKNMNDIKLTWSQFFRKQMESGKLSLKRESYLKDKYPEFANMGSVITKEESSTPF